MEIREIYDLIKAVIEEKRGNEAKILLSFTLDSTREKTVKAQIWIGEPNNSKWNFGEAERKDAKEAAEIALRKALAAL